MGDTAATRPTARAHAPPARIRHYELIRELGRGGMGTVYLARDTKLGRRVAIKFLSGTDVLAEARATARCNHENIVVVHEVDEVAGQAYMVLEYLEGRTLRQLLDAPMPAPRAIELIVPVVRALAHAHRDGIVHRDLKPENILVTETGQVKVLDFGVATLGDVREDGDELVGTLPYMAPEQWGADEVDARADLWAVGVVLFELIAGHHPLAPVTRERLLEAATRLDTPMPALPGELAPVIERCLAKRKRDRFATADELLAALEPHLPRRRLRGELQPYPGLVAFREEDADLFHGRRAEIAKLAALLGDRPLAAVTGASGAGKSSLVRAGLVPELKSRATWDIVAVRPGRKPLEALAAALDRPELATRFATEPGAFGEVLRERARARGVRVLVAVDQFEELFTLADDAATRATLACLRGAADDPGSPLRVVIALRADFLDRLAAVDRAFTDELAMLVLGPPGAAELRAALVEPARAAGYGFESPAMVDDIVAALAATAGALPLLQFAASRLWEERDRERRLITVAAYQRIGGIAGALATHADAVLDAMAQPARELARRVLVRLVTPERTRDVVELDDVLELGERRDVRTVVDHLVGARLLALRSTGGASSVELVHESLLDRWPTLRHWLDQTQEDAAFLARLRIAAKQWDDGGRSPGLVWRTEAEQDARRFARTYRGELGRRERAYLDAVFALGDRAARTRRWAVAGTIGVLGMLVVAAVVALVWIRDAESEAVREAERARGETDRARAANEQLQAEKTRQAELLDRLRQETAARDAARAAKDAATQQVEQGKVVLEKTNDQLRGALTRAQVQSKRAVDESERARAETERAIALKKVADEERVRAEELARKEKERADRRGKINTTLR